MSAVTSPAIARSSTIIAGGLCALAAVVAGATIARALGAHPDTTEGWLHAARYTARFSFELFVVVFVARPLHQLMPSGTTRWLVRNRRGLGLAFATAHFIHLYALVRFNVAAENVPDAVTLIFGGAAYVLLAAMVATSNDASVRRLGPRNWKRLHTVGMYWLWFIFFQSYAGRVADGQRGFVWLLGIAVAALLLRIAAHLKHRRRHATAA